MCLFKKTSKRNLASEKLCRQIWGALLKHWWLMALLIAGVILLCAQYNHCVRGCDRLAMIVNNSWYKLLLLSLGALLVISVCRTLTNIFNLRKNEIGITCSESSILFAIGAWILGFLLIFNIQEDSQYFIALGIVGSLIAWIFQDNVKGAVAFIHLRRNHLLSIDDWIEVPQYNVDGEVKRVTLTTITVYNWDTTTSSFPTSALYTGHFTNLQNMTENKTYGRQMKTSFIIDSSWIHTLSSEEANRLKETMKSDNNFHFLPENEITEGTLNAKLYRLYLHHWTMNQPHISQMPRLMIRWLEPTEHGIPLQVYAYITEGGVAAFSWEQSQIIEHILTSLEWFDLQLYQAPSGYDAGNTNVHITDKPATYRKEAKND